MYYYFSPLKILSNEPDEDLIDKISSNAQSRKICRWNNGRVGAIFPDISGNILDFREYKLYDGPDDNLSYPKGIRPVKEGDEENNECKELLASGIVAYYLNTRKKKNPKDIFAEYLEEKKKLFFFLRDGEMQAWNPKYKSEFPYLEHIKEEKLYIKISSRIFDFLSNDDVDEIKGMINNYMNFVEYQMFSNTKNLSWETEKMAFKYAVSYVMEIKRDGAYLFKNNTQWIAVYRFAIDKGIMYDVDDPKTPENFNEPQYAIFEKLVQELQLNENPSTRIPFTKNTINNLSKPTYNRYNKKYPWKGDDIKDSRSFLLYMEMENVYLALEKEYNSLISKKEGL